MITPFGRFNLLCTVYWLQHGLQYLRHDACARRASADCLYYTRSVVVITFLYVRLESTDA